MPARLIPCTACGRAILPGAARMRLHATPDGSVRHTRVIAWFHPECGAAIVDGLEARRGQVAEVRRPQWGRGPRFCGATA